MIDLVRDMLSPGGAVDRALRGGFESRPEQIEMAVGVARAMEAKSHLLAEAGTGVGKSFAYLVPAMIRCVVNAEIVVVATNTISLQEQLIQKDIPLLRAAVEDELRARALAPEGAALNPVLVKGRGNYVSIRRLRLASSRQDKLFTEAAARRSLHVIEDWAMQTRDGTLSTLPTLERPGVWDRVQSDSGNCMGKKCPNHQECFYQNARRTMEQGNLLICNHALFFSDLALRGQEAGFLPAYHHVVLDEGHNAEDVAADHFGVSLSEGRVAHLLSTLYSPRTSKGYLAHLGLIAGDTEAVDRAVHRVLGAQEAAHEFFEQVEKLLTPDGARGGPSSVRLRTPGAIRNTITPAFRELQLRLNSLKELVKSDPDRYELNAYAQRAELIATAAETLADMTLSGCAYWAEASGGGDDEGGRSRRRITLACAPVEVAPILRERLFNRETSVVVTSATLATASHPRDQTPSGAFTHAVKRLGCEGADTVQLGSPFDHASQVEFYVDLHADAPSRGGTGGSYLDSMATRVLHHVRATQGGAFVLFTSFSTLHSVADRLARPLREGGLTMLVQGRDGSRAHILERFREDHHAVLLGAASFWEGVDVRGQGLRNVIITKLPFDPPDRPLTEARAEAIKARGGDPFSEDSLPRAIIRFKQGFGRLIRSRADHGRVVVLDGRLLTARYGRLFLRALPNGIEPRILRPEPDDHAEPPVAWE